MQVLIVFVLSITICGQASASVKWVRAGASVFLYDANSFKRNGALVEFRMRTVEPDSLGSAVVDCDKGSMIVDTTKIEAGRWAWSDELVKVACKPGWKIWK